MKILIADDNPVFRHVLEKMLTNWGYDVKVAHDGSEAWQLLQREDRPPVAILDWMMPGISGIDVCSRVRASSFSHLTYVLILTARPESADLETAMAAGADDYVTKPFKSPELRTRVRNACELLDLRARAAYGRFLEDGAAGHKPETFAGPELN